MSSRLREPFGKAGLIVAIVALVAATVGGAYAANHGKRHNKKGNAVAAQAKRYSKAYSKRFSKAFSQRFATPGPAGPQGPAGAKGDKGDAGANGTNGTNGTDGTNGTNGTNGTSAEAVAYSGSECAGASGEEGVEVKSAAATQYVCNGANGENGETGYSEVLPPGKSEVGAWSVFGPPNENVTVPFSFNIPLPSAIGESNVVVVGEGEEGEVGECSEGSTKGTVAAPKASPGHFCVYILLSSGTFLEGSEGIVPQKIYNASTGFNGAGEAGAFLLTEAYPGEYAYGTWAVTAPTA